MVGFRAALAVLALYSGIARGVRLESESSSLAAESAVYDFESDFGGVADNTNLATANANTETLNAALAGLPTGSTLVFGNKTFSLQGGVVMNNLVDVTIQLDGTLLFSADVESWPLVDPTVDCSYKLKEILKSNVKSCYTQARVDAIAINNASGLTLTSSGAGTVNGQGGAWWGLINYLKFSNHRPILINVVIAKNLLLENWYLIDSPRFHFFSDQLEDTTIRYSHVWAARNKLPMHGLNNLLAFNTDGFDIAGRNIHVHDVTVWNQDDCVAVKASKAMVSENILVERVSASGLGLTIGAIGGNQHVNNVTFRDSVMPSTYKGIYIKLGTKGDTGSITNVLYQNISIDTPSQYGLFIGPAQQNIKSTSTTTLNPCQWNQANGCSLCWPMAPNARCFTVPGTMSNLTFRDITVTNPQKSPGVIFGNSSNPIDNVLFDNVVFKTRRQKSLSALKPFGSDYFYCPTDGITNAIAIGSTFPVPACFSDKTARV